MKIVFLDIDGVLLPCKQWLVPENAVALAILEGDEPKSPRERHTDAAARVRFDPTAVMLVNRLCARTGAKVCAHSNWRNGLMQNLREKLVAEGIAPENIHSIAACHFRGLRGANKCHDIAATMEVMREAILTEQKRAAGIDIAEDGLDPGEVDDVPIDFVVLDDEAVDLHGSPLNERLVRTDGDDGFGVREYRIALSLLDGSDARFGVAPIAPEDRRRVEAALGCGPVTALGWLHASETGMMSSRADRLNIEGMVEHFRQYGAYKTDERRLREAEERRGSVLKALEEEAALRRMARSGNAEIR